MSSKSRKAKHKEFCRASLNRRAPDGSKLFLTVEETAVHFNIDKSTVLTWIKQGIVPQHSLGGRVFFNKLEVEAYWSMFQSRR
jgi:excisionase family DNA binding protein